MFEIIVGSMLFIAAIYDLKTTEIPDEIPIFLIALGIFTSIFKWLFLNDITYLTKMLIVGSIFSIFGIIAYYTGQWGAGDSALLISIAFLYPDFVFIFKYLINLLIFGSIFMVTFSIIYCYIYSKNSLKIFFYHLKKFKLAYFMLFIIPIIIHFLFAHKILTVFSALLPILAILYNFGKIVEKYGFKRKIKVSELKVGDVLASFKIWRGITKEEIEKIKKSNKKFVIIKEGVRFAPAFFIAFIYTMIFNQAFLIKW
ncbi:MAG: prepilin peptidase [Candidatus Aenigmatarchaeota archaeon]